MRLSIIEEYFVSNLQEFIIFNGYQEECKLLFDTTKTEKGISFTLAIPEEEAIEKILDYVYKDRDEVYCIAEKEYGGEVIKITKIALLETEVLNK